MGAGLQGLPGHLLQVANGAKGSHDASVDVTHLREQRSHELSVAAGILGVSGVIELDYDDGGFSNDERLREILVTHIRRLRPDVVLGPDPTATFFGGAYVNHRDHRETGWALLDAVAPASGMPHAPSTPRPRASASAPTNSSALGHAILRGT